MEAESTVATNKGGCLGLRLTWRDETGPIDVTGREFVIFDAYPKALMDAPIAVVDAEAGQTRAFFSEPLKARMGMGRTNWVRIGMRFPGACMDTTTKVWIEVK